MTDYTEKIRNLLDLAESSNEHEARAALLKARQLMAKYKVSEEALKDAEKQEVDRKRSGVTYSMRRDPWVELLASVIARYHCCKDYRIHVKGKQTSEAAFIGLTNDVEMCMQIFLYAVDCIRSKTRKMRRDYSVTVADGYGYGFATGLKEAYEQQQEEKGWGLVLVVPKEVNDAVSKMKVVKTNGHAKKINDADARAFRSGMKDGREFKEQKRIGEEA